MSHDLAAPVTTGEQPRPQPTESFVRANRVSLLAALAAVALAIIVYAVSPNEHGLESLWSLLFHLLPFIAAAVAISWLDPAWSAKLRLQLFLPPLCFLVFFCFFVSHVFYYFAQNDFDTYFDSLYYTQLMLVPFIILTITLCVRLGGARTSTAMRLAFAMLLLQLSGIEDLSYRVIALIRDGRPIPEVWTWADHIAVRIGGHPTKYEAYAFITVHVIAAILVLALPGRLFRPLWDKVTRRPNGPSGSTAATRADTADKAAGPAGSTRTATDTSSQPAAEPAARSAD